MFAWAETRSLQKQFRFDDDHLFDLWFPVPGPSVLNPRAFVPARNYLLELFRLLDGIYTDMNHMTGGIVLTKDVDLMPGTQPIASHNNKKITRHSALSVSHACRAGTAVVVDVPVNSGAKQWHVGRSRARAALCALGSFDGDGRRSCRGPGLVGTDHDRFSTYCSRHPSLRDIILQKFRGVRRLICVLSVPFLSIFMFEKWFKSYGWIMCFGPLFVS